MADGTAVSMDGSQAGTIYTCGLEDFTTARSAWEARHGEGAGFDCPPAHCPPHGSDAVDSSLLIEALLAYYRTNKASR